MKKDTKLFLSFIKNKQILLIGTNGFRVHAINMTYYKLRNPHSVSKQQFSVAEMVYCVVYNCSTSSNVDKYVPFFSFPKDNARQKIWIHYCQRMNFVVTKHSRICGKHFSPIQFVNWH